MKEINYSEHFKNLSIILKEKWLLSQTPIRWTIEITLVSLLFVVWILLMWQLNIFITIIYFLFVFIRLTYIWHDLAHLQYYKNQKINRIITWISGTLFLWLSLKWWAHDHNNLHHTFTNSEIKDKDIQAIGQTFTKYKKWPDFLHKFRRLFFYLALPFMYLSFVYQSYKFDIQNKNYISFLLLIGNLIIFPINFVLSFWLINWIIWILSFYMILWVFYSAVFITNHIWMEVIEDDDYKKMPWLEMQTRTSRNISWKWIIHFIYWWLNTQIEHHIFPTASRFNLLKIAKITKKYCRENWIKYHTTSPIWAYIEIDKYLKSWKTI